jgi:hypothetical protein
MQKIHFATRVSVRLAPKSDASNSSNQLRWELNAQINKHKVSIDRNAFKKTPAEKMELKIAKAQWKAKQN